MTIKKMICVLAVAIMTTATAQAQQTACGCSQGGSGYEGQYNNPGTNAQALGHGCHRPWTYNQANALWAGYCHEQYVGDDGCSECGGIFGNLLGGGHGCGCGTAGGCGDCGSRWPSRCNDGCGNGCGCGAKLLNFGNLGCGAGRIGQGCAGNLFGKLSGGQGGFGWCGGNDCGCDSGCDTGCDTGCRHGLDLFSGLKSRGFGCGLGSLFGNSGCDSGCDSVPAYSGCGCD